MSLETPRVSSSAEEYLLTLYRLETSNERAGSSQLAKMFGVKAPSVTGMLRRLGERGWVRYQRYRPPELTDEGRRIAVRLVRRHRLLETFLVQFLDYSWDEVHEEVQQLEHTVSEKLLERIDIKLGRPRYDPHGDPIPGQDGRLPSHRLIPLTRLQEGGRAQVSRVDNRSRHLLTVLGEIGAYPGTSVTRLRTRRNGQLSLRVGRREIQLDGDIARLIWVKPNRAPVAMQARERGM
ncbi:MAG: Iron-dependent repressor IdeR [Calditrichaeota bacterium]|nr:Iron-dependent repressor IdeR [Calditrichota bacterium]